MKTVRVLYACMLPIVQYSKLQSHTHMTPVAAGILTAKLLRSDKKESHQIIAGVFFFSFFKNWIILDFLWNREPPTAITVMV